MLKPKQEINTIGHHNIFVDTGVQRNLYQGHDTTQKDLEYLSLLDQSYKQEMIHLKDLLLKDYQENQLNILDTSNIPKEPLHVLKSHIEKSINSVNNKVFSLEAVYNA